MKLVVLSAAAAMALTGAAYAESAKTPTMMTDAEMDRIVAGSHYKHIFTPGTFRSNSRGGSEALDKVAVHRLTPAGSVCVSIGGNFWCHP